MEVDEKEMKRRQKILAMARKLQIRDGEERKRKASLQKQKNATSYVPPVIILDSDTEDSVEKGREGIDSTGRSICAGTFLNSHRPELTGPTDGGREGGQADIGAVAESAMGGDEQQQHSELNVTVGDNKKADKGPNVAGPLKMDPVENAHAGKIYISK